MPEVKGSFRIINKLGMHARAAAVFVQTASRFSSDILVRKGGAEVNGKSIMGILQLATVQGEVIEIVARGRDGRQALDALEQLIQDRFGEEE